MFKKKPNYNRHTVKRFKHLWPRLSKAKRKFFIMKVLYIKLLACKTSNHYVFSSGLFILDQLMINFIPPAFNLRYSVISFGKYFYKSLRELQSFIKELRFNIKRLSNLKLLRTVSSQTFFNMRSLITPWSLNPDNSLFINQLKVCFSKNLKALDVFSKITSCFGLKLHFFDAILSKFNLYLFQLYLTLYELEALLQWFNWLLFHSPLNKKFYRFSKPKFLVSFLVDVRMYGYDFWHSKRFKQLQASHLKKFKLKKKWRFWRGFKRFLLFDKNRLFIKFKWLYNHKRLLNHQYIASYSTIIQSKLKQLYKKHTPQPRLFTYLFNFEFRVDVLSMRVFKIKSIKWVWLLLFFGYLSVNLNKKKKNYILKIGDMLFGLFLIKNRVFLAKLRFKFYKPRKLYSFLEYEPSINSFVCLSTPIKHSRKVANEDRLVTKKFIKYTYLNTY